MDYYSAFKRKEIQSNSTMYMNSEDIMQCENMNSEYVMQCEISKALKTKYLMISLIWISGKDLSSDK